MHWHIRILATFDIVVGATLGSVAAVEIYRSIGSFLPTPQGTLSFFVALIWAITGAAGMLMGLAIPALMIASGFGLLRMRPWARTLSIVLSMILLPAVPIGAAASSYFS